MSITVNPLIRVWDLPVRVCHAGVALCFAGAYLTADAERWRLAHVTLGCTALGLLAFRVLWGFAGTRFARFAAFRYGPAAAWRYLTDLLRGRPAHYTGHNPAGSWAIYALLGSGIATTVSGWLCFQGFGGEPLADAHGLLANGWLGLIALHLVAIGVSSWLHRENLARAMLTGYKRGAAGQAIPTSAAPTGVAVLIGALALAAGSWLWAGGGGAAATGAAASSAGATATATAAAHIAVAPPARIVED